MYSTTAQRSAEKSFQAACPTATACFRPFDWSHRQISRALPNFPRFAGPVPSIISSSSRVSLLLSDTQPLTGLVRRPEKIWRKDVFEKYDEKMWSLGLRENHWDRSSHSSHCLRDEVWKCAVGHCAQHTCWFDNGRRFSNSDWNLWNNPAIFSFVCLSCGADGASMSLRCSGFSFRKNCNPAK